ncbi:hypothetical protein N5V81_13165 [Escherichia coli]|nr:hypothetical protein [Escherichia coli]
MPESILTYVVGCYRRLRKLASSLSGAIEHTGRKIGEAKCASLMMKKIVHCLEVRLKELDAELQELNRTIEARPGLDNAASVDSIRKRIASLQPAVKLIMERYGVLPSDELINEFQSRVVAWREQAASAETECNMYNKELSQLLDEESRQAYLMRNHTGLKQTIDSLKRELATFANWMLTLFEEYPH